MNQIAASLATYEASKTLHPGNGAVKSTLEHILAQSDKERRQGDQSASVRKIGVFNRYN